MRIFSFGTGLIVDGYRGGAGRSEPITAARISAAGERRLKQPRLAEDDINLPAQLKRAREIMLQCRLSPEHEEKLAVLMA